jgi:hypothetical protein
MGSRFLFESSFQVVPFLLEPFVFGVELDECQYAKMRTVRKGYQEQGD